MSNARNSARLERSPVERILHWLVGCGRFFLLLLVVPVVLVIFNQPQTEHQAVAKKLEELALTQEKLAKELDQLKRQEQWIRNDPAYLELAARDARDRQRPEEYILRFE